jgi:hypothetical protein
LTRSVARGVITEMPRLFVEFWRLRQHAVAEELIRGGSRRRRTDRAWSLSPDVRERLRPLLEAGGFDPSGDISVREPPDRDGFEFTQGASPGGPDGTL